MKHNKPSSATGTMRPLIGRLAFWETLTAIGIWVGVLMIVQPFFQWAFGYGFVVLLGMTAAYVIVSHFPHRADDHG